jgi:YggT family protein
MLATISSLLIKGIEIYSYIIIGYILMSWFPNARETGIGRLLASISEPFLEPFRRFIPPLGMIDISPIVAIISLNLAQYGVYGLFQMLS